MLCSAILNTVRTITNDPNDVVYSLSQKEQALNEGIRAVSLHRPDSAAITTNVALVSGTKQSLPSDCVRLIRVIRNKSGPGGTTTGKSVRLMDLNRISDRVVDWHNVTGDDVLEYGYEQSNQNTFWVYPHIGSASDKFVEVIYQRSIPDVVSADTFPINDLYSVAVKEWMLYSLWSSDNEQSPNYQMAIKKLEVFFTILGLKGESDKNSPNDEKSRMT
jgi:hypothetical protein